MSEYIRKINYYETDKMGITHHSNYIRFMEEARMQFFDEIGFAYEKMEAEGIISPVVEVECHYKKSTTFGDEIRIKISLEEYSGVKLKLKYLITNAYSGDVVLEGKTVHCILNNEHNPVSARKKFPKLDEILKKEMHK